MASPQQEIQQLRRQIADANRTIQENESRNQAALCRTITELQKQYEKARNDQQQDYAARLRRIEESFSNVYIREAERSRQQYQALREKAEAYEQQLSEQIRALQNEQDRLIAEADARNFALRQKAQKALTGLERQIADACALPVDVFFPHCIQHYIEAGEEAKALLQARLYTLALSKADCARLFVTRLTSETQARQNELEALFLLYRQSYEVILQHLHSEETRCLSDPDGSVLLQLSEQDTSYWSDQLYTELSTTLDGHRAVLDAGINGWLKRCAGQPVSPTLLLDQEIQKLNALPDKLGLCISYALSACDSYNHTADRFESAVGLLKSQGFASETVTYGACRPGNNISEGYAHYQKASLFRAQCHTPGGAPDYREERMLTMTKRYPGTTEHDTVFLYAIPLRQAATVRAAFLLQLETLFLPQERAAQMAKRLSNLTGQPVTAAQRADPLPLQPDRPMTLQTAEQLTATVNDDQAVNKYSSDII